MIRAVLILLVFMLGGCAKLAKVELENASLSVGNINSKQTVLGDVYLYDRETGRAKFVKNISSTGLAMEGNKGSFEANASGGIKITYQGVVLEEQPMVTASIVDSLTFSMSEYEQTRFKYPYEVLNAKQVASFRADQAEFAKDRYRFLLVIQAFKGKSISLKFNDEENAGAQLKLKVGKQDISIVLNTRSSVTCEGKENACVVDVTLWKLVKKPGGATGYKFVQDTEYDEHALFQEVF